MTKAMRVIRSLETVYPDARCELNFESAYELLIATMLSAQSTDKRVNIVTKELFKEYNSAEKMVTLSEQELIEWIRTIGFFNTKAKHILQTSHILLQKYDGHVPKNREELVALPGVGRKTANVVLSNAFQIPAFAVDTHVGRVSRRLGLTKSEDPNVVEKDVTSKLPKYLYSKAHHLMIFHGRRCCKAQRPLCDECVVLQECSYYKESQKSKNKKVRRKDSK